MDFHDKEMFIDRVTFYNCLPGTRTRYVIYICSKDFLVKIDELLPLVMSWSAMGVKIIKFKSSNGA